jgi:hypothetical protein
MMLLRKISLICFLWSSVAGALTPVQKTTIDQFIFQRSKEMQSAGPIQAVKVQSDAKIETVEKKFFPISVYLERSRREMVSLRRDLDEAIKDAKDREPVNPYTDANWKDLSFRDVKQLCCEIKADPARQAKIQDRVARGLSALGGRHGGRRGGHDNEDDEDEGEDDVSADGVKAEGKGGDGGGKSGGGRRGGGRRGAKGGGGGGGRGKGGGGKGGKG